MNLLAFPLEIISLISLGMGLSELGYLCAVSKGHWHVFSSFYWRDVQGLDVVLALILGSKPAHGQGDTCTMTMPETVDLERMKRFTSIAPLIHSLLIYREGQSVPLYLSPGVYQFLAQQAAKAALLPNLVSISLGRCQFVPGIGRDPISTYVDDRYSIQLLHIFAIGSNVKEMTLSGWGDRLILGRFDACALSIRRLSLCVTKPWAEVTDKSTPGNWMATWGTCLSSWRSLQSLTISTCILQSDSSLLLGRLPDLRFLQLIGPFEDVNSPDNWSMLHFEHTSFPRLLTLSLSHVTIESAQQLMVHPAIMARLTRLELYYVESEIDYVALDPCLEIIAAQAQNLTWLCVEGLNYLSDGSANSIPLLHEQPLKHIELRGLLLSDSAFPSLAMANPALQYLDVENISVPTTFLRTLATAYPSLLYLSIGLRRPESDSYLLQPTPASHFPIQLKSDIDPETLVKISTREELATSMHHLGEYLHNIWPRIEVCQRAVKVGQEESMRMKLRHRMHLMLQGELYKARIADAEKRAARAEAKCKLLQGETERILEEVGVIQETARMRT